VTEKRNACPPHSYTVQDLKWRAIRAFNEARQMLFVSNLRANNTGETTCLGVTPFRPGAWSRNHQPCSDSENWQRWVT
jgi:hypothetical protein